MGHVLAEAAEAFFHIDSKIFLSLRTLIRRPGRLTAEFFMGRRKPYMSPLQLFFVCNLIFFVLQPFTGLEILGPPLRAFENNTFLRRVAQPLVAKKLAQEHIARTDADKMAEFAQRFDRVSHLQAKTLVLLMAPMLASVLALFYLGSRHFFTEHLIFALHGYAWWLLWLLLVLVSISLLFVTMRATGHPFSLGVLDEAATLLEFGGFAAYLGLGMKEFYRGGVTATVARAVPLALATYFIFHLYRLVLLFTILFAV